MKMLRTASLAVCAVVLSIIGVIQVGNLETHRLQRQVDSLEKAREQLAGFVRRLSASHRVAQLTVTGQRPDERGQPTTTFVWQELGDGEIVPQPQSVTVQGTTVYLEALILKFDFEDVGSAELSKNSVALFRRAFGDLQSPSSGVAIDHVDAASSQFASDSAAATHWELFWDFVENRRLAKAYHVRVAQIEAPAVPMRIGQVWEVMLDAAGGINLRKIRDGNDLTAKAP